MRPWKIITNLLLILLLSFSASGLVSAKVASGLQNLSAGLLQGQSLFNALPCLEKSEYSTTHTPGCSVVARGAGAAEDFFAGTKYTDKVLGQVKQGDLHAFPESVKAFQDAGQVSKITGGDGVARDMLKIPGEYRGKQGAFEFIKEADGSINHRLFRPTPGQ